MDMKLICPECGVKFVWSHDEQVAAAKAIPLDDLLDAPGDEKPHFVEPPKLCGSCKTRKAGA